MGDNLARVLELASAGESEALSTFLDQNGLSPNVRDENGWSPLIMASKVCVYLKRCMELADPFLQNGHVDTVKCLFSKGANPNSPDISHTAIRAAALFGHHKIIRLLLSQRVFFFSNPYSHLFCILCIDLKTNYRAACNGHLDMCAN